MEITPVPLEELKEALDALPGQRLDPEEERRRRAYLEGQLAQKREADQAA